MLPVKMTVVLFLLSGAPGYPARDHTRTRPAVPQDFAVTLQREGCWGGCPVSKITITADGGAILEGQRWAKTGGVARTRISQKKLERLISEFEKINFFSLRDEYAWGFIGTSPNSLPLSCITCAATVVTSLRLKGAAKTVTRYEGCQGAEPLESLSSLEDVIYRVAGTDRW
jgi:hypothetical protein